MRNFALRPTDAYGLQGAKTEHRGGISIQLQSGPCKRYVKKREV